MTSADYPAEVLITDDDPITCYVLRMYLESFGCRVIVAGDGNQALGELRDAGGRIGLVILDLLMPGPPAIELHNRLRDVDPSVPILYCSGVSSDDPLADEIRAHGMPLLEKPFSREGLQQAISEVLRQSELQPACCR